MGDHEYEPVAAPRPAPPPVFVGWEADEDPEGLHRRLENIEGDKDVLEREFLHAGLEDDIGAPPVDGAGEEEAMEEIQGTPPSPSPPSLSRTPTTESRTDCELTTSQVESSGLEELPLRRSDRGGGLRGAGPFASSIKRKIRNQAGRLRTKMRSIPRPTFRVPEGLMRNSGKGASVAQDSASSTADTMERPLRTEKKRPASHLFDFRTYPRIIERKLKTRGEFFSKRAASSSGNEDNTGGPSGAPPRKKGPFGTRWAHRFSDIRFADDEETAGSPSKENGSTSSLRGSAPGGSWSGGSMGQDVGGATGGRPGVLEEIDADEFFLREKGLSRDDLRRGEEISSEIRDALRPSADEERAAEEEEEEEEVEEEEEEEEVNVEVQMTPPQRPSRRSTSASEQRVIIDQGFMTFPPQRPNRRKGLMVRAGECDTIEDTEEEKRLWDKEIVVEGAIMAENLVGEEWEEGWGKKEEEEVEGKVEGGGEEEGQGGWGGYIGDRLRGWLGGEGDTSGGEAQQEEEVAEQIEPPMPPKRRRRGADEHSAVSLDESRGISSEEVRMEEFDHSSTNVSLGQQPSASPHIFSTLAGMDSLQTGPDPEYASPTREVVPPTAPRRTRSLPRRPKEKEEPTSTLPRDSVSVPARPHRRSKMGEFFTVPRRKQKKQELPPSPPQRPARSGYATPGPPKAPQRRRASTPLPLSIPASEDLESGEERVKELTAGEVVSKMRGRPLPPPPRPPRRDRTQSADRSAWEEVVEGHLTLGSDRGPESVTSTKSLSEVERLPPEEVSIAIQTDPLPYEYCMEDGVLEDGVILMSSEQTSEGAGRRSPLSWPTPPPTPPPTARRQRRQAASRRAMATSISQESTQMEAVTVQEATPAESLLPATEHPPPTPPKSPAIERRIPTPQDTVDVASTTLQTSTQERFAEDEPPSIPPLPAIIPPREIPPVAPPPENPPILPQEPQTVAPTLATSALPPVETEKVQTQEPQTVVSTLATSALPPPVETEKVQTQESTKPVTTGEPTLRLKEQVIEVTSEPQTQSLQPTEVPVQKPSPVPPTVEDVPPVAPPRPPKPAPKPAEIPSPPVTSPESSEAFEPSQQPSIPPPSFQQLRSPTTTEEPQPQQMHFPPPPSYYFPPQATSEDHQGRSMPFPSPPMGAVALLCVGEISARKLVVSEFQGPNFGPQESSEAPPQDPRRSSTRGSDFGGRRRMPSLPTRRRPPPRRSQSESGKEGVSKEDYTADPEDPELPGVGELSGRLARACGNAAVSTVRQLLLTAVERVEGDGRTEAAIIIALVMAVALVVLTMGHTRQGHRWDFYLPPAP